MVTARNRTTSSDTSVQLTIFKLSIILHIEIRQLRYFVVAADTMSFSRAASLLGVKQFTLSKSIAALEAQLGAKLFERTTRGAITLEFSKVFVEIARRILTEVELTCNGFAPATYLITPPWPRMRAG